MGADQHPRISVQPLVRGWLLLCVLWICVGTSQAELPQARLWSIFPPGGQAGSTLEVTVNGGDLDDPTELHFSNPAITAALKLKPGSTEPEPNKFVVMIDTNSPCGIYDVRLRGRFGLSNPRIFSISKQPETIETEPNNSREQAQALAGTGTINGTADAENYDFFGVPWKAGERVVLRCAAKSIDSRMQPVVTVFDPAGREVFRMAREAGEFEVVKEGVHLVQVHDLLYKGGAEYWYRLEFGALPQVQRVTFEGETEKKAVAQGINLGAEHKLVRDEDVPSGAAVAALSVPLGRARVETAHGSSNPLLLPRAEWGEIREAGEYPVKAEVPSTWNGVFRPVKTPAALIFSAEKGEVVWIEIVSSRLGYATDPHILVQRITRNDKGEEQFHDLKEAYDLDQNIGPREFNTTSRDAAVRFEAPEKSDYRIVARDLFNLTAEKRFYPFVLQIRRETPDFQLAVAPYAPPNQNKDLKTGPIWETMLRKGDAQPMRVLAFRRDGFAGEIQLRAEGLPSGVRLVPSLIPAGVSSQTVMIQTDENAGGFAGAFRLMGEAAINGKTVTRAAGGMTQLWNVDDYTREPTLTRSAAPALFVSENEVAPMAFTVPGGAIETAPGGKVQLPITIARRGEFNNPVKFRLLVDPLKEWEVDGKATNSAVEVEVTPTKLGVGTHYLFAVGHTSGKYRRVTPAEAATVEERIKSLQGNKEAEATVKTLQAKLATADVNASVWAGPFTVRVNASPITLAAAEPAVALTRGGKSELTVKVERLYGFNEAVELAVALPGELKGISAQKLTIPAGQTEGKVAFESATDVPGGEWEVALSGISKWNGQESKVQIPLKVRLP